MSYNSRQGEGGIVADDPIQLALDAVEAQIGPAFESVNVVINSLYPAEHLPTEPFAVVPFQVQAWKHTKPLAGINGTGRNAIFEGVALVNNGVVEIYADSMSILSELGIQVALRPPISLERDIEVEDPVPGATEIAIDQDETMADADESLHLPPSGLHQGATGSHLRQGD